MGKTGRVSHQRCLLSFTFLLYGNYQHCPSYAVPIVRYFTTIVAIVSPPSYNLRYEVHVSETTLQAIIQQGLIPMLPLFSSLILPLPLFSKVSFPCHHYSAESHSIIQQYMQCHSHHNLCACKLQQSAEGGVALAKALAVCII